jgi:hypothetical protein
MSEIWKPVVDYEGFYEVSNQGRIKSIPRIAPGKKKKTLKEERILKLTESRGYLRTFLAKSGKVKSPYVHRLVYEAFVGVIPPGHQVDHTDGNKLNNCLENLQCFSRREHRRLTLSRQQHASGERIWNSKLTQEKADEIRDRLKRGETHKEIAKDYGISWQTVSALASGRTWTKNKTPEYMIGHKDGYKEGYKEGFQAGYQAGRNSILNHAIPMDIEE